VSPKKTPGPGFDPRIIDQYTVEDKFRDRLTNAGCVGPEKVYALTNTVAPSSWGMAVCPESAGKSLATINSGVLQCDSCTGDPGDGKVVVVWLIDTFDHCWPGSDGVQHCGTPGTGCDAFSCSCGTMDCLSSSQLGLLTTPPPVPPPIVAPPPHAQVTPQPGAPLND
jgi:hypothetical protein